jgi:Arc/MetJ family transcription regulator
MRTNIDIDETLMRRAMRNSGTSTKKATVETALRLLVDTYSQGAIRRFRGKIRWQGNLRRSRLGRIPE